MLELHLLFTGSAAAVNMRFQAPENLSEYIAQHFGHRILKMIFSPGQRIQELEVAAEPIVTRCSDRGALLILERRQLVKIPPRRRTVISSLPAGSVQSLYTTCTPLLIFLAETLEKLWPAVCRTVHLTRQIGRSDAEHSQEFLRELIAQAQKRNRDGAVRTTRKFRERQRQLAPTALAKDSQLTHPVSS